VLALAAGSTAAAAGPGSGYRQKATRPGVRATQLDTRAHRALLGLYALESRLETARARVAALTARSSRLQARQATLEQLLQAARRTLVVSQQELGNHLRALYEQGRPDPLAVLLGAQSLADAISKLDTLTRFADQSRHVVAATSAAQERLVRVRSLLVEEGRRLDVSLGAARSAEQTLAVDRASRVSYVRSIRAQQHLDESRVRDMLATARAVVQKGHRIEVASAASVRAPVPAPAPAAPAETTTSVASPQSASAPGTRRGVGTTLRMSATGYSLPGHTATGMPVGWGVVAVDPSVIPLGTRLSIPGYGEAVAADVGSGVRGTMIDLWFPTLAEAQAWGRRTVTITIH